MVEPPEVGDKGGAEACNAFGEASDALVGILCAFYC